MKIKKNIMEILIFMGVLTILYYSSDPVYYSDSSRYINGSLLDPPMYSSIIFILQNLFGKLESVVVFQTLLIGFGIIYFTRTISVILNLNSFIKIIVSLLLFVPILKFYDNVLTEPISYAFTLLFVSCVIKLIYNFNFKNLILTILFAISLLLTRNQFLFLYPVILLLFFGIFIINKSKKKVAKLLISSFLVIVITHNLIILINTYLNQDSFNKEYVTKNNNWKESLTYISLGPSYFVFIDAIYISSIKDVKLFENQNHQKTLTKIFNEMDDQKSLAKYYDGRGHFSKSFSDIRDYSQDLLLDLAKEENTSVSNLKKEIALTLISANFGKYIKQIFKKFYDSTWLFVFIPFFILISSLIGFLKNKSRLSLVTIFVSSFVLANHSLVYIFGRVQPRYLIYSDFIFIVFIFLFFIIFFQKKNKDFL